MLRACSAWRPDPPLYQNARAHRAAWAPVHGDRTTRVSGAGWELLFVAIDDHARIAFTQMYCDETKQNAIDFLGKAHAWLIALGIKPKAILTDNGSTFRSKAFGAAVQALGLKSRFTRL